MVISLFFPLVSSLSITEVELNPLGSDSGNEWIEIYSSESISLEGHYLENEDGNIYNLNGTISNYHVFQFPKQWLDNSKSIIKIKKDNSTIYETSELADSKNNDFTLSLCNNEYKLTESSKGSENKCDSNYQNNSQPSNNLTNTDNFNDSDSTDNSQNNDEINNGEENKTAITSNTIQQSNEIINQQIKNNDSEKIFLNSKKDNKIIYNSKEDKTKLYIVYTFTFLCILIIILLALRKL